MNATVLLSRMFDRWYRRQVARKHLLEQVRFGRRQVDDDSMRDGVRPLNDNFRLGRPGHRRREA